jgi:hypothetical protein
VLAVAKAWRHVIKDPQEVAMLECSEKAAGDAWEMTEDDMQQLRKVGFSTDRNSPTPSVSCSTRMTWKTVLSLSKR